MKQKNLVLLPAAIITVILVGYGYRIVRESNSTKTTSQNAQVSQVKSEITFPTGGETLYKGQTYQITWSGGKKAEALFLSNVALQKEGLSVSIADRVYNLPNISSYAYTIPENIPDGIYEISIAGFTSKAFQISSEN